MFANIIDANHIAEEPTSPRPVDLGLPRLQSSGLDSGELPTEVLPTASDTQEPHAFELGFLDHFLQSCGRYVKEGLSNQDIYRQECKHFRLPPNHDVAVRLSNKAGVYDMQVVGRGIQRPAGLSTGKSLHCGRVRQW